MWQINGIGLVDTELPYDKMCMTRKALGDSVRIIGVVYKTASMFDDDIDPTIRSTSTTRSICNGRVIRKLVRCELAGEIVGTIVGFRMLSPVRVAEFCNDNERPSYKKTEAPRQPYVLVCCWSTHKPILVCPDDVWSGDDNDEYDFNWRKKLPEHPDKVFWAEVAKDTRVLDYAF